MSRRNFKERIEAWGKFFKHDIWINDWSEVNRFKSNIIRHIKITILTFKNINSQRLVQEAVGLSFNTILGSVPLVAITLYIASKFSLDDTLRVLIYQNLSDLVNQNILDLILEWSNNFIKSVNSGWFGLIGLFTFGWLIILIMTSVEGAFNHVWNTNKSRNIIKRFSIYLAIIFLAPFIVILFLQGIATFSGFITVLAEYKFFSIFSSLLYLVALFILSIVIFSLMYKFIPNTYVEYRSCLKAALITSVAFIVVQYLYLGTQLMVTRLNAVYGAFAAIPLAMIWVNMCWNVILIGASLCRAYQHVDDYIPEIDNI